MGVMLAEPGFHTRCFVEWEEYPRRTLIAAQRAGYFQPAPIWDDVTRFNAHPFAGAFDTLIAGYPCQPFSQAGQRRGEKDERHLWPDIERIIGELGPDLEWIILENVAGHITLGLETVLRALWNMGFTPAVGLFSAGETGAPHERQRIFIVAHREGGDGRGEQPAGSAWRGRAGPSGSGPKLAYGDGGDASAERQQRGGQQRLHPQGGSDPIELDDATGPRRQPAGIGSGAGREGGECLSGAGCGEMGHAPGLGCGEGRAEPEFRSGRNTASGTGGDVADPERGAGYEGRASDGGGGAGAGREGEATRAFGPRPLIFPPGPSDADAWALVLHGSPHLAPALGRQGIVHASFTRAAQLLAADAEAAAQPGPGSMARGIEAAGLGRPAERLLDPREIEPFVRRMADGLASRPRALRLLGNGVLPLEAAYAVRSLAAAHGLRPVDLEAVGWESKDERARTTDADMREAAE